VSDSDVWAPVMDAIAQRLALGEAALSHPVGRIARHRAATLLGQCVPGELIDAIEDEIVILRCAPVSCVNDAATWRLVSLPHGQS
jgi:hypothetical protein